MRLVRFYSFVLVAILAFMPLRSVMADKYFNADVAKDFVLSFDFMGVNASMPTAELVEKIEAQGYTTPKPPLNWGARYTNDKKMYFKMMSPRDTKLLESEWEMMVFGSLNEPCPSSVIAGFNKICEGHYGANGPCYKNESLGSKDMSIDTNLGEVASDGRIYAMSVGILKTGTCSVSIQRKLWRKAR